MARVFGAMRGAESNEPAANLYPDSVAPVIRSGGDGQREIVNMRWGFPPPPIGNALVTNVRNTVSAFWRPWLKVEYRCLIPVSRFCEWTDAKPKRQVWFALNEDEPLFAFAGIWRPWCGLRGTKKEPVEGQHEVFSFLTCEPSPIVAPVHAKAMPVVLTSRDEFRAWLEAPPEDALKLQRPFSDLAIVA